MKLNEYLRELQTEESVFPIDSPHRNREPLRTPYPPMHRKKREEEEEEDL